MQKLENMAKFVNFVFVMNILLSLFLVATSSRWNVQCVYDGDCIKEVNCEFPAQPRCRKSVCVCRY
ncbi:unnamed protein product [Trifolium pratense]|uniref:Uncharacterized protein n=1 Tax=Trifolium pratense TaxID=57577 RepID=A0ACB0LKX1_TRIPR|nr:unnamed protein product [Trifolium pratense]